MISAFIRGIAQGMGVMIGVVVLIIMMRLSSQLLIKLNLFSDSDKVQELKQEYKNEAERFSREYGL